MGTDSRRAGTTERRRTGPARGSPESASGGRARLGRPMAAAAALLVGLVLAAPGAAQAPEELAERARAAGANPALVDGVLTRARQAGAEPSVTARLLRPAVELGEAGLPSTLVLQKSLEGLAKGVPARRVASVVENLQASVVAGGGLVDPWLENPRVRELVGAGPDGRPGRSVLIESTASALSQGASSDLVTTFLERVPATLRRQSVTPLELGVAVEVLSDLPVAARDPAMGADVLVSALDAGFGPSELRELPEALRMAERRGQLPAEAVARGAMAQMGELPAAAVLRNLFQGDFPGKAPFEVPPGLERGRERGGGPPP